MTGLYRSLFGSILLIGIATAFTPAALPAQTAAERMRVEERLQRAQERLRTAQEARRAQMEEALIQVREQLARTEVQKRLAQREFREQMASEGIQERLAQAEIQEQMARKGIQERLAQAEIQEQMARMGIQERLAQRELREQLARTEVQKRLAQANARDQRAAQMRMEELQGALARAETRIREVRTWHGLILTEMNSGLAQYFASDRGLLVLGVDEGSALGLSPGDVILSIGGRAVKDRAHAIRILDSYGPDEVVSLAIVRKGERMDLEGTVR